MRRPTALTSGKHTIVFDFKYDGPGFGKGGTGAHMLNAASALGRYIRTHARRGHENSLQQSGVAANPRRPSRPSMIAVSVD